MQRCLNIVLRARPYSLKGSTEKDSRHFNSFIRSYQTKNSILTSRCFLRRTEIVDVLSTLHAGTRNIIKGFMGEF